MEYITRVLELDPELIGFIFYPPSPRYMVGRLSPEEVSGLPGKIIKTGVFVNASVEEIKRAVDDYRLDMVQLHGEESPATCRILNESGHEVIKAFSIGENVDFEAYKEYIPYCKFFLFDTVTIGKGGSGRKFNWDILKNYTLDQPWFLSGGIAMEDAFDIAGPKYPGLAGVDLNSRFEISPGIKDTEKLRTFIQEIRRSQS